MTEILEISRTRCVTPENLIGQRALRAQWEYKHRALRTITRTESHVQPSRPPAADLTRPETLTRPPISTPREYQTPMETVLSFEPLLMPSSGTGRCGARPGYACAREKRESRRDDDRFYDLVKICPTDLPGHAGNVKTSPFRVDTPRVSQAGTRVGGSIATGSRSLRAPDFLPSFLPFWIYLCTAEKVCLVVGAVSVSVSVRVCLFFVPNYCSVRGKMQRVCRPEDFAAVECRSRCN